MSERKRGRQSSAATTETKKKNTALKKKKWAKKARSDQDQGDVVPAKGPIFVVPEDGSAFPEALERIVSKPFVRSIYVDPKTRSLRYPVAGRPDAIMTGLHVRMLHRFFRGIELDNERSKKAWPKRLRSSKEEGSRADKALAECIRTGQPPPPAHHKGASEYASAVWTYWREHHHRPVLAQLPVILVDALAATAGDYFTVHRCPFTGRETLCMWELKTGFPKEDEDPPSMTIPMPVPEGQREPERVPLTSMNRYYLQVLLTQMAYERELGLHVDGTVRVINAYKEREDRSKGDTRAPTYKCKVVEIGPEHLNPPRWPERVLKDALYKGIKKQ
jgi:hypothetical protein